MKTFIQPGKTLSLTAPYAVTSGKGALVTPIFGVAVNDVASGAAGEFMTEGVFYLLKASGAWTAGDAIYWDDSAKNCTKTATGNKLIGMATQDAASGDTSGYVR